MKQNSNLDASMFSEELTDEDIAAIRASHKPMSVADAKGAEGAAANANADDSSNLLSLLGGLDNNVLPNGKTAEQEQAEQWVSKNRKQTKQPPVQTPPTPVIEEEEIEDDEEIVEETPQQQIQQQGQLGTEPTIEGNGVDENELSVVQGFFNAISEELGVDTTTLESTPQTVEDFVDFFKNTVTEASQPVYASQETQAIDEFVRNGGDLKQYLKTMREASVDTTDITTESNQELVVRELLKEKGFSDNQIERKIQRYKDLDVLEDEATDAVEALKDIKSAQQQQLLAQQKAQHEQAVQQQQQFEQSVLKNISELKAVRGIAVPEKDKKALIDYLFKFDANGQSQYQKDYYSDIRHLIESAYFTMKGDTLLDSAKKAGATSALKSFKQSLHSSGVGRGTGKVPTSKSESIWSLAVKQM
jgi:type II secretory pathway pseudopilin PulG